MEEKTVKEEEKKAESTVKDQPNPNIPGPVTTGQALDNKAKISNEFLRVDHANQPIPIDLTDMRQNEPSTNAAINTINVDEILARELQMEEQNQYIPSYPRYMPPIPPNIIGCLNVNILQAQLNKSYGLVRMDPYVKLRIGNYLFETSTNTNGSTSPSWNQMISGYVAKGISSIFVEIYDERSFTEDEKIAWATIPLPPRLFQNETVEEWYPLSGKLGPDQEGQIHLIMTMMPMGVPPQGSPQPLPNINPMTPQTATLVPQNNAPPPPNALTPQAYQEMIKRLKEMFPSFDDEIIVSVFEGNSRLEGPTINALLALNDK